MENVRPRIYGHRGCRGLRPENTIPAFLHALDWGVDGLELDVVVAASGELVVSHEPWLNADICTSPAGAVLTSAEGQTYNLFQLTYGAIRQCDCGSRSHPRFPEQVNSPAFKPLLSEVFAAVASRCAELGKPLPAYAIELKSAPESDGIYHPAPEQFVALVEAALAAATRHKLISADVLLMSFDHRVVQAARHSTTYPVCLLIEDARPVDEHIAQLGFLPDVIGPDYQLLSTGFLSFCAHAQLPIITWTVNDPAAMLYVSQMGVLGITTDYPDRANRVFGS